MSGRNNPEKRGPNRVAAIAAASAATWRALETTAAHRVITALAVAWTLAAGVLFGTFAAGGGDSYGYVSQALLFAEGRLTDTVPLDPSYQWYDAHRTMTPLGFAPGAVSGVIAPTYPPGLPLLMAPAAFVSDAGVYFVVPLLGGLSVFLCYRIGRACGDPHAGAIAAALFSVSPAFAYHVVQPMSDVPAAAGWLAALLFAARGTFASSGWAGAAASLAILIRPNLAPLAAVPLALALVQAPLGTRSRRAAAFIAAMAPAGVALAWIQTVRFGSPIASGYGDLGYLFAWGNVLPNLARYPRWLTETHTWFIWLSVLAPFTVMHREPRARPLRWAALAFSAGVLAIYLPYEQFEAHEWTYSRFLLPAIPLMLLLAALVALALIRRFPLVSRAPLTLTLAGLLIVVGIHRADRGHAFEVRRGEQRYVHAGEQVHRRLPKDAIVLAIQHSGSIRLYGQRPILRWDLIDPRALDSVFTTLRASGRMPFLVADVFELDRFRTRFANQSAVRRMRLVRSVDSVEIYAFD